MGRTKTIDNPCGCCGGTTGGRQCSCECTSWAAFYLKQYGQSEGCEPEIVSLNGLSGSVIIPASDDCGGRQTCPFREIGV
jgi:hypothetical protein